MVVDDHEVVRDGLVRFLEDQTTRVVATAASAAEALEKLNNASPHAVLMDIRMDEFDGLWALEKIKEASPRLPVVLLTSYENPTYMARAVALGASDYLLKNASRQVIMDAIHRSIQGDPMPTDGFLSRIRRSMDDSRAASPQVLDFLLTPREVQVLRHIGLALSNKEIARCLQISVETVKEHVQNILRKTKASDRTDAAVKAVRWGLVE